MLGTEWLRTNPSSLYLALGPTTFDMFLLMCIKASIFIVLISLPGTILSTLPVLTYSVSPQPQE